MANTLEVPGARLHYEVRGSGPVLLMIPAGAMDSTSFDGIAPLLAEEYTVVTYDPRGFYRSVREDETADIDLEVQADDAHRLLAALGTEPAYVFGTSSGALAGLTLVERHPEQVRTLVAHEPPITELLPDRAKYRAEGEEVYRAYRTSGVGAALAKFLEQEGWEAESQPEGEPDPAMERMMRNCDVFYGHMFHTLMGYLPNDAALRAASTRIVVARGKASEGETAHRAATALAELLGTTLVDVPGDHMGYATEAEAFAAALRRALTT